MDSSNAEKAARAAYIAFHEGLSGFDSARAWDDMTSPADDWSQEAIDWTHAVKVALSSRDAEVAELTAENERLRENRGWDGAGRETPMPEYTPTTEEVRAVWCAFSEYGGLVDRPHSGLWDDRLAEFDRWLAARDRENRAIGWDEGAEMVLRAEGIENVANTLANLAENGHPNPYRGDNR